MPERLSEFRTKAWKKGDQRGAPVPLWHHDRSRPWLVNIIYKKMERLIEAVEQFVDVVLAKASKPSCETSSPVDLSKFSTSAMAGAMLSS